jgi:hypothetical protein
MALLLPWIIFLFVGAYDWGFYAHALVSTQAAVRAAVLYTSSSSANVTDPNGIACGIALGELRVVSNIGSSLTTCAAAPVVLSATKVTGPDGDTNVAQVSVAYTTVQVIPIPGLLTGQTVIYRVLQMKVRS